MYNLIYNIKIIIVLPLVLSGIASVLHISYTFRLFYRQYEWERPYILLPKKKIFQYLLEFSILELCLFSFLFNKMYYVAVPFLIIFGYLYYLYIKIWCLFKFSIIHIIILNIIIIILAYLLAYFI